MVLMLLVVLIAISTLSYAAVPTVSSASPSSGNRGQTLDVTVRGNNFTGIKNVSFGTGGDIKTNSFTVRSATEIRANIRIYTSAGLGPYDIHVNNPDGTGRGLRLFTVAGNPLIRSIVPNSGARGSAIDVTIVGEGFYGMTSLSLGSGIEVSSYRALGEYKPVTIQATLRILAAALPGTRDVTVNTNHGSATLRAGFTVTALEGVGLAPVVNSVTPSVGYREETKNITIRGRNFTGAPTIRFSSSGITVNGAPTRASAEEIRANITISRDAPTGPRDVTVDCGVLEGTGSGLFRVDIFH